MGRIVDLDAHELRVRFTGLELLKKRRRELRIPRTAIRSVSTRAFDPARRTPGRRYLVSYDDPAKTMTVEVVRGETKYRYDVLVLGV